MIRCAASSRITTRISGFIVATALLCGGAKGYVLNGKKWANGPIVLQMGLGNAPAPLLDGNTSWNSAALPALTLWNHVMARIQVSGVVNSTAPVASNDGVNSVVFSNTVFGQAFGTGVLAVTYYMMQGPNMIEADVLFNRAQTFDSYRGPLRFDAPGGYARGDIRRIFLHEFGHGLGLEHSPGDNIMAPVMSNRETPSADDIAGVQSMYGVPVPTATPSPTPTSNGSHVRNDFNVDSKADVVWQNRSTGQRAVWLMNGMTKVGESALPLVAPAWQIVGSGDFNGDGYSDIVWQNTVTGQGSIWLMNRAAIIGTRTLPTVSVQWQMAATGDFNSDGQVDLVWQNTVTGQRAVWFMNGSTMTETRSLQSVSLEWQIAGAGDFNNDRKPDLVWQNLVTGQRAVWLMNGTAMIGSRNLPSAAVQWRIAGTGDFNLDGQLDLIWENKLTGQRGIWRMNGTQLLSAVMLPTTATQWEIRNH